VKWTDDRTVYHGKIVGTNDSSYEVAPYVYESDTFDESTVRELTDDDLETWVGPSARSCGGETCSCGCHTTDNQSSTDTTTMTDNDSDNDINFDSIVGGMTVDAVAEQNENVRQLAEDKKEYEDRIDVLEDKVDTLETSLDEAETKLEAFENGEREPKSAVVDSITDLTSAWDEDELMDLDREELERRKKVAEDAASSPSTPDEGDESSTENSGTDVTNDSADDGPTVSNEHRTWAN